MPNRIVQQTKQKLNDRWFRFVGIPLIALVGHIVFFNRNHGHDERFGFWIIYLLSLAETVVLWEAIRLVLKYYRRRFPGLHETRKRVLWQLLISALVTLVIRTVNIWIYDKTEFWGYRFPLEGYLYNFFVALVLVCFLGGVYEGIYYFRMWHQASVEAEVLKKENLQTQLDSLKTQINPHFLFNNLSSLSSLIWEDQQRAVNFVEELSAVYRYLLQANEKTLTTLAGEMQFIDAYFALLKNRFGNGILLKTCIDDQYRCYLLPPLTVQLLLENAVKHNAIMPENPLEIQIFTREGGKLVISNSIRKKSSPVVSGRLGITNIVTKYSLLKQPPVEIKEENTSFEVSVPLIKPDAYESADS